MHRLQARLLEQRPRCRSLPTVSARLPLLDYVPGMRIGARPISAVTTFGYTKKEMYVYRSFFVRVCMLRANKGMSVKSHRQSVVRGCCRVLWSKREAFGMHHVRSERRLLSGVCAFLRGWDLRPSQLPTDQFPPTHSDVARPSESDG